MIRKISNSVSFRLELRMEFLFDPEHFFSVGKYFHSTERWQDCIYSKLEATVFFFFFYREKRRFGWEQLETRRHAGGCMQFPRVYSDVVDIEEERGGGVLYTAGEGNKFRRVALLWSIKGLPGRFYPKLSKKNWSPPSLFFPLPNPEN